MQMKEKMIGGDGQLSGSDDSLSGLEDSQESTLIEICDLDNEIKSTIVDLETVQKKKKVAAMLLQDSI